MSAAPGRGHNSLRRLATSSASMQLPRLRHRTEADSLTTGFTPRRSLVRSQYRPPVQRPVPITELAVSDLRTAPERVAYVLDGPLGELLAAASADRAAAAPGCWAGGVLAQGAALVYPAQLVKPGPDIADLEPVQPLGTQPLEIRLPPRSCSDCAGPGCILVMSLRNLRRCGGV